MNRTTIVNPATVPTMASIRFHVGRALIVLMCGCVLSTVSESTLGADSPRRPNIVFILADDI